MKFTDPVIFAPKQKPPVNSWWAASDVQNDREKFSNVARTEQQRLMGNTRFGGSKTPYAKFEKDLKK